jgi:predicted Rossmann fold nucleotide-binding protein DprA/Smf involved in DNA uptake
MSLTPTSLHTIAPNDPAYPTPLKICPAFKTPPPLNAIGNLELLAQPAIALFCSSQCPDDLIPKIHALAHALREAKILVMSGFHSPIEQDCLSILRQGTQPIIHCPARSLHTLRLSPEQAEAIAENRLLILSPFSASYDRATAKLAEKRNEMVGAIAPMIFIAYAAPNSNTLAFAQPLIQQGKSVITLNAPIHSALHHQGIAGTDIDDILQRYRQNYRRTC